ncbi:MAG: hypothetical protein K9N49_09560 [Candidatus Marinimicrobia bacterium]|nr:hypothetical protein [Candidatus Neomarinimicrobiota bacterium]
MRARPSPWILALGLLLLPGMLAAGTTFEQMEAWDVAGEEVIAGPAWRYADQARVAGTVSDDLFLAASELAELTGTLGRDLWCFAPVIRSSGEVAGHARLLAARNAAVEARIAGTLMAAGPTLALGAANEVAGDVLLMGDTVLVEGLIRGNLWVYAQQVTLAADVGGNVRLIAADIVVQPRTRIAGDLVYTLPDNRELIVGAQAEIKGELRAAPSPFAGRAAPTLATRAMTQSYFLLAALLVAVLWQAGAPGLAVGARGVLLAGFWKTALIGSLAFILLPLLALVAAVSIVGLPLAALLGALWLAGLYLGQIAAAYALGSALRGAKPEETLGRRLGLSLFGLALLFLAGLLPLLGELIGWIAALVGLGAVLRALSGVKSQWVVIVGDKQPAPPTALDNKEEER